MFILFFLISPTTYANEMMETNPELVNNEIENAYINGNTIKTTEDKPDSFIEESIGSQNETMMEEIQAPDVVISETLSQNTDEDIEGSEVLPDFTEENEGNVGTLDSNQEANTEEILESDAQVEKTIPDSEISEIKSNENESLESDDLLISTTSNAKRSTPMTVNSVQSISSFPKGTLFFTTKLDNTPVYSVKDTLSAPIGTLNHNIEYRLLENIDDHWIKITFGGMIGYVKKEQLAPSTGQNIIEKNPGLPTLYQETAQSNVILYNRMSSNEVVGKINQGIVYSIVGTAGPSRLAVDVGGRLVFVSRLPFTSSTKYFKTLYETSVYGNMNGSYQEIGRLNGGTEYQITGSKVGSKIPINFGGTTGYIEERHLRPSTGTDILEKNPGLRALYQETAQSNVTLYNRMSSNEVVGKINQGIVYSIVGTAGPSRLAVDVGGRLVFIDRDPITADTQYFQTLYPVNVKQKNNGQYVTMGSLGVGNHYKISQVIDSNYVLIDFAGRGVYVESRHIIANEGNNFIITSRPYRPNYELVPTVKSGEIYLEPSSTSKSLASFSKGKEIYVVYTKTPGYYGVTIGGMFGYILTDTVHSKKTISVSNNSFYNVSLDELLKIQMTKRPQDSINYYSAYFPSQALQKTNDGFEVISQWGVRSSPNLNSHIIGTINLGEIVQVKSEENGWSEINYRVTAYIDSNNQKQYKYRSFVNASEANVRYYINPENFKNDPILKYQFLDLSIPANIDITEVNDSFLSEKGILTNKAQVFVQASQQANVSEIYLIAHALLETGNGTSTLANGVMYEGKKVYNMFGIGAIDTDPIKYGAKTAYEKGWDTPEKAIIGGAKWIGEKYINHPDYKQNTLYKMRWNPEIPGEHQYATDIRWSVKQTDRIAKMYNGLIQKTEFFDIPLYK